MRYYEPIICNKKGERFQRSNFGANFATSMPVQAGSQPADYPMLSPYPGQSTVFCLKEREHMDTIPLQDAIRALRAEILAAHAEASTEEVRFELGPIEMEFQVVARREIGAEAKLG